jgi:hypothetical protein
MAWTQKLNDLKLQKKQYEKRIAILAKVIKEIEEDLQK